MNAWTVSAVAPDGDSGTNVMVEANTELGAIRKGRQVLGNTCKGWTFSARERNPNQVGF